jgi:hypothetical protein
MGFDVLPQGAYDNRSGLRMHAQQSSQSGIELELQRLIIQQ